MRDLIKSIKAWLAIVAGLVHPAFDRLIAGVKIWWNLIIIGAITSAVDILAVVLPSLRPAALAFRDAITAAGPIADDLKVGFVALANSTLAETSAGVSGAGVSTPDNATDLAAAAFATAFGNGLASAGVAALFESAFPEKLNVLDGLAPLLAKMAGFDEVAGEVLGPLYKNAFGRSLEYHYRALFKPELPDEADAITWHARRLLTDDQLRTIFGFSGLKPEYEAPFVASAYRAIQPRMFSTLLLDQPFPADQVQSAMEFAGLRPDDVTFLLGALELNSTKNVRAQYLSAAVRSAELGTMTPAELDQAMTSLNFSDDAKSWVQLTVATRKLEQLAELYRKSITEAYRTGQLTDAQYVPALQAIGIGEADANAHYAIDSIAQRGKLLSAAARAEAALERKRTSAAMAAAIASYKTGALNDAELEAALIAAGVDPAIAGYVLVVQSERRAGPLVFVYGLELPRKDALVLKETVAAIEAQYKKQLIDDATAANALAQNNIPDANAKALLATWAALKTKPTTTGEQLPR